MRLVNYEEFVHLPNGTVFSVAKTNEIAELKQHPERGQLLSISNINIMHGHSDTEESGHFNGVMHLIEYIGVLGNVQTGNFGYYDNGVDTDLTDTTQIDYDPHDFFIIFDMGDISAILAALSEALAIQMRGKE